MDAHARKCIPKMLGLPSAKQSLLARLFKLPKPVVGEEGLDVQDFCKKVKSPQKAIHHIGTLQITSPRLSLEEKIQEVKQRLGEEKVISKEEAEGYQKFINENPLTKDSSYDLKTRVNYATRKLNEYNEQQLQQKQPKKNEIQQESNLKNESVKPQEVETNIPSSSVNEKPVFMEHATLLEIGQNLGLLKEQKIALEGCESQLKHATEEKKITEEISVGFENLGGIESKDEPEKIPQLQSEIYEIRKSIDEIEGRLGESIDKLLYQEILTWRENIKTCDAYLINPNHKDKKGSIERVKILKATYEQELQKLEKQFATVLENKRLEYAKLVKEHSDWPELYKQQMKK